MVYDIIEAINSYIKDGTLVLHRSMKVHPRFKVYKTFCYNLYYVDRLSKDLLFSCEETENSPSEDLKTVWDKCDKLFLKKLVKWMSTDNYKKLIGNGI